MPAKPLTANAQDLAKAEHDAERWAHVGAERQSIPPISPRAPSDPAESEDVDLTREGCQTRQRAGQKRLGEDGLPQTPPVPE
jgi:hypothetical protein